MALAGSTVVDESIDRLVRDVAGAVNPIRIILFGSHARGEAHPESDVDFLVVVSDEMRPLAVARKVYREVACSGLAFDVVVVSLSQLKQYGDSPGLIYDTILREGRVVYERSNHA